jgi:hypothetical protein
MLLAENLSAFIGIVGVGMRTTACLSKGLDRINVGVSNTVQQSVFDSITHMEKTSPQQCTCAMISGDKCHFTT